MKDGSIHHNKGFKMKTYILECLTNGIWIHYDSLDAIPCNPDDEYYEADDWRIYPEDDSSDHSTLFWRVDEWVDAVNA